VQAGTEVVHQQEPQRTQSDREIMTAPYSICHPCPMAGSALRHCPELEHCSRKDHQCPRSRHRARLHSTSTRSSQCPRWALPPRTLCARPQDACTHTRTSTRTPTSTPTRATANEAHNALSHTCTRTRRALTYETMGAAPRWTREQWRSATKASKRRPSTRCKRTARSKSKSEAPLDLAALATLSSSIKSRSSPAGSRWCQ
jgi:hypothetical protein